MLIGIWRKLKRTLPFVCPYCGRFAKVYRQRRLASYVDDESNFLTCCADCHQRDYEEMEEQWDEYYRGRL